MSGKHTTEGRPSKLQPVLEFVKRKKYIILTVLFAIIVVIASAILISRYLETKASEKMLEKAQQAVTIVENTPKPTPKQEEKKEEEEPEEKEPEIEKPPIEVDWEMLKELNPDIYGWLYCEDSVINFEVMHAKDNYFYLCHLLDGSYNQYGTIFSDYRCAPDFSDANTIIYGHDMQNGSMFGSLELYRDQQYYEDHSIIYLLTPEQNYKLEIVCGFIHTAAISMYDLPTRQSDLNGFLPEALATSTFKPLYEVQPGDRFVTLSACADDYVGARYAIICRMVEIG